MIFSATDNRKALAWAFPSFRLNELEHSITKVTMSTFTCTKVEVETKKAQR